MGKEDRRRKTFGLSPPAEREEDIGIVIMQELAVKKLGQYPRLSDLHPQEITSRYFLWSLKKLQLVEQRFEYGLPYYVKVQLLNGKHITDLAKELGVPRAYLWAMCTYLNMLMSKQSESRRQLWQHPEYRERQLMARNSPSYKGNRSSSMKRVWQDPLFMQRQTETYQDPAYKARCSAMMKQRWENPEYREKMTRGIIEAKRRQRDSLSTRQNKKMHENWLRSHKKYHSRC